MNVHSPAIVASAFRESRIVAFSTGNIYPLVDVFHQGATEQTAPGPRGEVTSTTTLLPSAVAGSSPLRTN